MVKNLKLVNCDEKFWEFVRILRTDSRNLNGFIQSNPITPEQQQEYMKRFHTNYKICLLDNVPVGFIGAINGDIRVCTDHNYKTLGIGSFMVQEFTKTTPNIFAKVKVDNLSSLKLFESCNYKIRYYILEPQTI